MRKAKNAFYIVFTLGLLSALGPFSIDMYLPGFKAIADSLDTTINKVGLSLSAFFIGISIGQFIYGPLLDRFGRKIPLYIGLVVYCMASIVCSMAWNVESLIIIRIIQALGSCAGMVAARALVRDLFPVEENAKVFSYIMLVIALSPLFAPTTGGYIAATLGWRAIFIILAIISVLAILAVYFWLPKGNEPDKEKSLKPGPIFQSFWAVAKVPHFYTYALVSALSASGMYAYLSGAPFVFMKLYGVSEKEFGWIFAIIGIGMAIAGQINTLVLRKFKSEQVTLIALIVQVLTGCFLVLFAYSGFLNLYSTIALMWVYMITQGFIYPNSSALSLAPFSKTAGTASSLMGAVQLGIGAFVTAIVSALNSTSALPMTTVMLICASSAFILLLIGRNFVQKSHFPNPAVLAS